MEQRSPLTARILIIALRSQIEEAFARGDLPTALALSRQMDSIQVQRWERQLCKGS